MKSNRGGCLVMVMLPLAAILCLGGLYAANVMLGLPDQAEAEFGPSGPSVSGLQLIRLSAMLLAEQEALTRPLDPGGADQRFEVGLGESVPSVLDRLWRSGLIPDPAALRTYLQYSGLDTTLQAGTYTLSPAMTPLEIAGELQDATPSEVPFRVLAGWRVEEIAAALPSSGLQISVEEFLAAAAGRPLNHALAAELPPGAGVEGFLYPEVYTLPRGLSARELVSTLLDGFEAGVSAELQSGFARQGLSLFEAVTLASIVEREAVQAEESPLVASVFFNRLRAGMS